MPDIFDQLAAQDSKPSKTTKATQPRDIFDVLAAGGSTALPPQVPSTSKGTNQADVDALMNSLVGPSKRRTLDNTPISPSALSPVYEARKKQRAQLSSTSAGRVKLAIEDALRRQTEADEAYKREHPYQYAPAKVLGFMSGFLPGVASGVAETPGATGLAYPVSGIMQQLAGQEGDILDDQAFRAAVAKLPLSDRMALSAQFGRGLFGPKSEEIRTGIAKKTTLGQIVNSLQQTGYGLGSNLLTYGAPGASRVAAGAEGTAAAPALNLAERAATGAFGATAAKGAYDAATDPNKTLAEKVTEGVTNAVFAAAGAKGALKRSPVKTKAGAAPAEAREADASASTALPSESVTPVDRVASRASGLASRTLDAANEAAKEAAKNTPQAQTPAGDALDHLAAADANVKVPTFKRVGTNAGGNLEYFEADAGEYYSRPIGSKSAPARVGRAFNPATGIYPDGPAQSTPLKSPASATPLETGKTMKSAAVAREDVTDFSRPEEANALLQVMKAQHPDADPQVIQRGKRWVLTTRAGYDFTAPKATAEPPATKPAVPSRTVPDALNAAGEGVGTPKSPQTGNQRLGERATAYTADNTPVETRYALVPGDELIASHTDAMRENPAYEKTLQPRDRTRQASEAQVNDIAAKLNPERVGESPTTSEGAPIVGPDKMVESGNGRTLGILRAYGRKLPTAEVYRAWLRENATRFGLDPAEVDRIDKPVLVRVREGEISPSERAALAENMGRSGVSGMSEVETARTDAQRLNDAGLLRQYVPNEEGNVGSVANQGFVRAFVSNLPAGERNTMMQADGTLSAPGARRIRNAILASAYDDPVSLQRVIEDPDPNIRNVGTAMLSAAPKFAAFKEELAKGNRHALDISGDVAEAANRLSHLRDQGIPVERYLKQGELFGESLSPVGKRLLELFDTYKRSGKKTAALLNAYADAAEYAGDPKQSTIFGGEAPTAADILEAARLHVERTTTNDAAAAAAKAANQSDLFGAETPEGESAQSSNPAGSSGSEGPSAGAGGRNPQEGDTTGGRVVPGSSTASKPPLWDALSKESLGSTGGKVVSDLVEGVFHYAAQVFTSGARTLKAFTLAMVRAYGESIRSHVQTLWRYASAVHRQPTGVAPIKGLTVDLSDAPGVALAADAARNLFTENASYVNRVAPESLDKLVALDKASTWVSNYFMPHVVEPVLSKLQGEDRARFTAYAIYDRLVMDREVTRAAAALLPNNAPIEAVEALQKQLGGIQDAMAHFADPTIGKVVSEADVKAFFARKDIASVADGYRSQVQPEMEAMRLRTGRKDLAATGFYSDIFMPGIAVDGETVRTGAGGAAPFTKPLFAMNQAPGRGKFTGTADAYLYDPSAVLQTRMNATVRSAFQREFWQQMVKDGLAQQPQTLAAGDVVRVRGKHWGGVRITDVSDPLTVEVQTQGGKTVKVDRSLIDGEGLNKTVDVQEGKNTVTLPAQLIDLTESRFGRGGIPEEELRALGIPRQVIVPQKVLKEIEGAFTRIGEKEYSPLGQTLHTIFLAGPTEGIVHGVNLSGRLAATIPVRTGVPLLDAALDVARPVKSVAHWKNLLKGNYTEGERAQAQRVASEYGVAREFQDTWGFLGLKAGGKILYGAKGLFNNALATIYTYGKAQGWSDTEIGHVMRTLNTHSRVLQPEVQRFVQQNLGLGSFYNTGKTTVNVGLRYHAVPTVLATSLLSMAALHYWLDPKHRWPWQVPGRRIGEIPVAVDKHGKETVVDISGLNRPGKKVEELVSDLMVGATSERSWDAGWDVAARSANLVLDPIASGPVGGVAATTAGLSPHLVASRDTHGIGFLTPPSAKYPLTSRERVVAGLESVAPSSNYALGSQSDEYQSAPEDARLRYANRITRLLGVQFKDRTPDIFDALAMKERMKKDRSELRGRIMSEMKRGQ